MRQPSRAGAARVDITPQGNVRLGSYARTEEATGVLDPLYLTALVLSPDERTPIALLAVDHVALLVAEADKLRRAVAQEMGVAPQRVMVQTSHTHSSPRMTEKYLACLETSAVLATRDAIGRLRPVNLGWGTGRAQVGLNRRTLANRARSEMRISPRPALDDRVGVLLVEAEDGTPVAVVVWHGVHPNVLMGDSNVVSADWPGAVRCIVETSLGCPMLFAVGAAANVDPIQRGNEDALRRIGLCVGGEVLKTVGQIRTHPFSLGEVATASLTMTFSPLPSEADAERLAADMAERFQMDASRWLAAVRHHLSRQEQVPPVTMEVQCLRLNEGVLGGLPMEVFNEIGAAVATPFGNAPVFFGGCTNGWIGYLPPPEEYVAEGFELGMLPVKYGWITGWLTPPTPETAASVIASARELISGLFASPASQDTETASVTTGRDTTTK